MAVASGKSIGPSATKNLAPWAAGEPSPLVPEDDTETPPLRIPQRPNFWGPSVNFEQEVTLFAQSFLLALGCSVY